MTDEELKSFLDEKADLYNRTAFIESDPILVPHQYEKREDIEIMGFLTATIAWGQRKTIINNALKMGGLLGDQPYDFIMDSGNSDLSALSHFKHRTFNGEDLTCFVLALRRIYQNFGSMEAAFSMGDTFRERISAFKETFFEGSLTSRSKKHVSDPLKGSAAKRINMYLRWMIRKDNRGVDFGIWNQFGMDELYVPLDVHTGNVARKLGLLNRRQNDWQAVEELTEKLRMMDKSDPVKYDFALFGVGVFDGF